MSTKDLVVERLDRNASGDDVAAVLERDGCCVVERLVDPDVMDAVRAELAPYVETTRVGRDEFTGTATRRTGSLVERSPTFVEHLVAHPLVMAAAGKVLTSHATTFQLHLTQVICIGPGETGQLVHRDQWAFDFFPFPTGWDVLSNTMWALSDFTVENGGTRVIPGSNHWEDKLRPAYEDTVGTAMPKGSVLFYTGSVYHGGGANLTDEHRWGINVAYAAGWLRQEENQYLAVSQDAARHLPEHVLRLIGYQMGAYALGYVGDTQDPIDVLLGRSGRTGLGPRPRVEFAPPAPETAV